MWYSLSIRTQGSSCRRCKPLFTCSGLAVGYRFSVGNFFSPFWLQQLGVAPTDDVSAVHSFLDTIFGRCIVISFCFGGRVDALGSGRLRNNLVARKVVAAPADTPPAT
jgi:hypothetical protein